ILRNSEICFGNTVDNTDKSEKSNQKYIDLYLDGGMVLSGFFYSFSEAFGKIKEYNFIYFSEILFTGSE
ncbi:MAG TPA: hypothetical protein PL048_13130, partial [Leptospiraceae bacterium]|nr:hypothetical protein [Leptospiraceae bacterium]